MKKLLLISLMTYGICVLGQIENDIAPYNYGVVYSGNRSHDEWNYAIEHNAYWRYSFVKPAFPTDTVRTIFGTNGAGYFENMTPEAETWVIILAIDAVDAIRVTGGAIAKFADPYTNRQGWGMTHHLVDSLFKTTEETEAESATKWHQKVDNQPDRSYMDDLIALQIKKPNMEVIWVANMFLPPSKTVNALRYMRERGVNFVGVEGGNETYNQLEHNFTDYMRKATAMRDAIKAEFPDLWFSQVAAPINVTRGDHIRWNDSLDMWMPEGDYITIHYYVGEREFPSMTGLTGKGYDAPTQALTTQFQNIRSEMISYQFTFQAGVNKFDRAGGFIVTETNTKPSKSLGNTYLNAEWLYREMMLNKHLFKYFCLHNGVAPDVYGIIFGKPSEKNTSYEALKLAIECGEQEMFVNDGEAYTIQGEAVWITAPFLSSSQLTFGRGSTIPANSFGYIIEACEQLTFYRDADGDGFGSLEAAQGCIVLPGYVLNNLDCDDQDATTFPGNIEECNGMDDNCDGLSDEGLTVYSYWSDFDLDGFGEAISSPYSFCDDDEDPNTNPIPGFVRNNTDCNDVLPSVNPGAIEIPDNTIDENCDGVIEVTQPPTCMKKGFLYFIRKKCETTTNLDKCNCPK